MADLDVSSKLRRLYPSRATADRRYGVEPRLRDAMHNSRLGVRLFPGRPFALRARPTPRPPESLRRSSTRPT